jgi:hypothetical protein
VLRKDISVSDSAVIPSRLRKDGRHPSSPVKVPQGRRGWNRDAENRPTTVHREDTKGTKECHRAGGALIPVFVPFVSSW